MAQTLTVAKVGDIPDGDAVVVAADGRDVAVFCSGGQYYAIDDLCPHAGASLSTGFIEDGCVTCPWHFWRFQLTDGAMPDNPKVRAGSYPVRIEGNNVIVEVP